VYFNLRSKDVIHAFWIPAFRLQEDVVPGITTHYRATPDRLRHLPGGLNPRPARQLSGRLQPALWRRTLADALHRARGPACAIPGLAEKPGALRLHRRDRVDRPPGERCTAWQHRVSRPPGR